MRPLRYLFNWLLSTLLLLLLLLMMMMMMMMMMSLIMVLGVVAVVLPWQRLLQAWAGQTVGCQRLWLAGFAASEQQRRVVFVQTQLIQRLLLQTPACNYNYNYYCEPLQLLYATTTMTTTKTTTTISRTIQLQRQLQLHLQLQQLQQLKPLQLLAGLI